tara:strand:- start:321 stop:506 length:186 start_codon:yes stop_codon:yes gene_type:complete
MELANPFLKELFSCRYDHSTANNGQFIDHQAFGYAIANHTIGSTNAPTPSKILKIRKVLLI